MAWSIFREGGGDSVAVAWAQQFLTDLGAPVTPGNTQFVYQWERSEGGGGAYNPLNTGGVASRPDLTTSGTQYGGGANDYAGWEAGLTGSVINVTTPGPDNYPAIVQALKNNDPLAARQALWNSGWAASHYGFGANWANVPLPGNTSPIDFSTLAGSSATGSATATGGGSGPNPDTCLLGWYSTTPGAKPPWGLGWVHKLKQFENPSSFGVCLLSKTQGRAFLGSMFLVMGGAVILFGVLSLVKSQSSAVKVFANVPIAGRAVSRIVR